MQSDGHCRHILSLDCFSPFLAVWEGLQPCRNVRIQHCLRNPDRYFIPWFFFVFHSVNTRPIACGDLLSKNGLQSYSRDVQRMGNRACCHCSSIVHALLRGPWNVPLGRCVSGAWNGRFSETSMPFAVKGGLISISFSGLSLLYSFICAPVSLFDSYLN